MSNNLGRHHGEVVLALNSGSSSLKFGLYQIASRAIQPLFSGEAELIASAAGKITLRDSTDGIVATKLSALHDQRAAIIDVVELLAAHGAPEPNAVGHRVVHGGQALRNHCILDDEVIKKLEVASAFARSHMTTALSLVAFAMKRYSSAIQVACFDTAFHRHLPPRARVLPIAHKWRSQGIERYGFHGLSCESVVRQWEGKLPSRLIIAHLGNGSSVTAVQRGQSVDTSMGLTPAGGVIMGTRSGDLDPGLLVYLLRQEHFVVDQLGDMIEHQSGLLGISGVSNDMRQLHGASAQSIDAQLAIEMYCYSCAKQIAAMMSVLDGVDAIVFTGGIGENDPIIRSRICAQLNWAGVQLDEPRNSAASSCIAGKSSKADVRIVQSQEEMQIASDVVDLLQARTDQAPSGIDHR